MCVEFVDKSESVEYRFGGVSGKFLKYFLKFRNFTGEN
jgi:hypothetical protein